MGLFSEMMDETRQSDEILLMVRRIADMQLYGTEMGWDGDDACEALNGLIEEARFLLKPKESRDG